MMTLMMVYQGRHKGGTNGTGARPALSLLWEVGLPSHNLLLLCVGEGGGGGKRERERWRMAGRRWVRGW